MAAVEALPTLLERTAQGDRAAFRALYDRTAPHLFGVALRITRNRETASDALQEAFLRIWRGAARFDATRGSADAWLAAIVRYRAIDVVRAQVPTDEPSEADLPAWPAADAADAAALQRCLQELPPDRQRLVLLAFVEGFSHSELASRLEAPLGTVKSWIRRSLEMLRACLSG